MPDPLEIDTYLCEIENSESMGKHCLSVRTDKGLVYFHTDYYCRIEKMAQLITQVAKHHAETQYYDSSRE